MNTEYVSPVPLNALAEERLRQILEDYVGETSSSSAKGMLADWDAQRHNFLWLLPNKVAAQFLVETEHASGAAA
jgi:glutamate synthase domain-containing protein 3